MEFAYNILGLVIMVVVFISSITVNLIKEL